MPLNPSMQVITMEMANKIYAVLVKHAGAPDAEGERIGFVSKVSVNAKPRPTHEYRFGGSLNPGAKFYNNWGVFVGCYQDWFNDKKATIIKRCHEEFRKLGLKVGRD